MSSLVFRVGSFLLKNNKLQEIRYFEFCRSKLQNEYHLKMCSHFEALKIKNFRGKIEKSWSLFFFSSKGEPTLGTYRAET